MRIQRAWRSERQALAAITVELDPKVGGSIRGTQHQRGPGEQPRS